VKSDILESSGSIKDVFALVKDAVEHVLGESRDGLDIGFVEMGNTHQCVFAFYPVGSNIIVMNKTPIRRIMETKPELLKPYVFTTLLHEYLHSLGYLDEAEVRQLACIISQKLFGDTIAAELACNMEKYLKYLIYPEGFPQLESEVQVLEMDEQDYIG
jgi:hypothetical protein